MGYKRNRAAASLSSAGSAENLFLMSTNSMTNGGDELANVFSSMELSKLLDGGSSGLPSERPRLPPSNLTASSLSLQPGEGDAHLDEAMARRQGMQQASVNSEDMEALIQAGLLPTGPVGGVESSTASAASSATTSTSAATSTATTSAATPLTRQGSGGEGTSPVDLGRDRSSSDQTRPLWRSVLQSVEKTSVALTQLKDSPGVAPSDMISTIQRFLANFYIELNPKITALGPPAVVCERYLAALLSAPPPESVSALVQAAQQTFAALKRYATSAMLAPIVAPRSGSSAGSSAGVTRPTLHKVASTIQEEEHESNRSAFYDRCSYASADQDDASPPELPEPPMLTEGIPKLHACKNCQRAKTACSDHRPCQRCVRLGVPCDGDMRAVKRACAACKKSKVKCDLDDRHPNPCSRCTRLSVPCTPHLPNKKKRTNGAADDLGESSNEAFAPSAPCEAFAPSAQGGAAGFNNQGAGLADLGIPLSDGFFEECLSELTGNQLTAPSVLPPPPSHPALAVSTQPASAGVTTADAQLSPSQMMAQLQQMGPTPITSETRSRGPSASLSALGGLFSGGRPASSSLVGPEDSVGKQSTASDPQLGTLDDVVGTMLAGMQDSGSAGGGTPYEGRSRDYSMDDASKGQDRQ
mmetsp:Transcript_55047/g.109272  ORF Transcript_55047/g.109272 Transcript_55047/m.109272 type:complete len:641 (-) Transcript_55047:263-2185(-)